MSESFNEGRFPQAENLPGRSISAQRTWNTHGINADSSDYLGTTNYEPLRIKTDSVDRIIVGVNDSIEFKGTALFDSINSYLV